MITLVTSRFQDVTPDRTLLQDFEQFCVREAVWQTKQGPLLFSPGQVSSRLYTALHLASRPFLKDSKRQGAIISLGMAARNYLFSKTFPHFSLDYALRVLWVYDVWQPRYQEIESLVRESRTNLLLLSSWQATEHFRELNIPDCTVHWVPETIDTDAYHYKPWAQRKTNVLSFGRSYLDYHREIVAGCRANSIQYSYQQRDETRDVATQGMKTSTLLFPTQQDFIEGLADAQICLCFPRSLTHPTQAGDVSTLTLRYLQAMAAKCLVLGVAPLDANYLFGYNPVVEVDWQDPVGQIQAILENPAPYQALIERNYQYVCSHLHYRNALATINELTVDRMQEVVV